MLIALGADHAGFELKEALKPLLDARGVRWHDFGTTATTSVDYPDYARAVADAVAGGTADRGILVCGSGVGMAIAANKVAGIRAASILDTDEGRRGWGLKLMRGLMDDVKVEQTDDGTRITMVKYLRSPEAS